MSTGGTRPCWTRAVADWGAQMAAGLAAAHARGLVHRDVKPANAMFDAHGVLKLVDFGLVKQVDPSTRDGQPRSVLTSDGAIVGSPAYMSPEQVRGAALGPATDVFSLGVVLYELACGVRPFGGATAVEAMAAILRDRPRPLRERVRSIPSAFAELVDACLVAAAATLPVLRDETRIASGFVLGVAYDEAGTLWFTEGRRLHRRPAGGAPELVPTQSFVSTIACCAGGRIIALGPEGAASIDPTTLKEQPAGEPFFSHAGDWWALTPNGRHVAHSEALKLTFHEPTTGENLQRDLEAELGFAGEGMRVAAPLEWSPDGRWLAALHFGPPYPDPDEEVVLVDPLRAGRSIDLLHVDAPSLGPVANAMGLAWIGSRRLLVAEAAGRPRWIEILVNEDGKIVRKAEHDMGGRLLEPRSAHGDQIAYRELYTLAEPVVLKLAEDGTASESDAISTKGGVERIGGWLADGRLVYSRRNDALDAVELVAARPGGGEQTIHPESAGGRALALAVVGDDIVHRLTSTADPSSAIWVARSDFRISSAGAASSASRPTVGSTCSTTVGATTVPSPTPRAAA